MAKKMLAAGIALAVAVSLGACDDGWQGPPYYSYPYQRVLCEQFTTCESCTPVLGCGWCSSSAGSGCVRDPDRCGTESFNFTWNIEGCGTSKGDGGPSDSGARD